MMASQKNNLVVSYFTLDISDFALSSNQNAISCEYQIISDTSGNVEVLANDVIDTNLIDKLGRKENNNDHQEIMASQLCGNDDEMSINKMSSDESEDLEDLTNLNWLTELKNITNLPPAANEIMQKPCDPPSQRFDKFINQVHKIKDNYDKRSEIYRLTTSEKPPYNYAQIIAMAMLDEGRMTLKQICDWIETRFAYYRVHRNWNNSIRHNLSLNFFFSKVARDKNEKGKGGYWELAVDCNKTARKRIRQRKKKFGFISNQRINAKSKARNEKQKISYNNSPATSNDAFLSSPSNGNDDSNLSMDDYTHEIEIIEEQQNINNIIDDNQQEIIISNPIFESPNVIVEPIPSYQFTHFNQIESFDDNEFSELICMNDQDLIDDFLNYNTETEQFL